MIRSALLLALILGLPGCSGDETVAGVDRAWSAEPDMPVPIANNASAGWSWAA